MSRADTHCPYCSLQCGMSLERTGRTLEVQPWAEFPVNEGALCRKGWTAASLLFASTTWTPTTSSAAVSVDTSSAVAAIRARSDGDLTATGSRPRGRC